MDYWQYRRHGLAIGSGITEAACKTLFTQRFKQSGMKWSLEGGQVVVNLCQQRFESGPKTRGGPGPGAGD